MTELPHHPPKIIMIGSEMLMMAEGGEEWSLCDDDPQLDLCKKDWDYFDPAEFQPVDFRAAIHELSKSA